MATEQELADMERMSTEYVPDTKGPLVGGQQSTQLLVAEYAQADPVYVHKSAALPSRYSHYRTVRGDGNCGWRALAFGYFEALLRIGDPDKIRTEMVKLTSFNKTLVNLGYDTMLFEDFVDATLELLERTAASLPNHDGEAIILQTFNEDETSSQIVYHFRLITSAWMKSHANYYAGFLESGDVNAYCQHNIDPFAVEMEHFGLQALATALINEAGIAIEVLYLDRSTGSEVTPHKFSVLDATGNEVDSLSTIRLLYRPGHYDLLYKTEDIVNMSVAALSNPEIRLVSDNPSFLAADNLSFSHNSTLDPLLDLPGFSLGFAPSTFAPLSYQSPKETTISPIPLSPVATEESLSPARNQKASPPQTLPTQLKIRPHLNQYRYEFLEPEAINNREDSPDLSKREDAAHFMNDSFQPQLWRPGKEYDAVWDKEDSSKSSS